MIWTNPLAWLGLAAVAVPLVIHLLARETQAPIPFPTLRFLRATALVDVRRRRLSDLALLVVRAAIILLAVAALAQPFMAAPHTSAVSRVAVIDASASVDLEAARAAARGIADGGAPVTTIERARLPSALHEAAAWAASQAGPSTVVVISDFQRGALHPDALRMLPESCGIELRRVGSRRLAAQLHGGAQVSIDGDRTSAAWTMAPRPAADVSIESAHPASANRAILAAAQETAAAFAGGVRPATFVLPNAPRRGALAAASQPAHATWMFDVMQAITRGRARSVMISGGRAIVFLASDDPGLAADAIREALPALAAGPPIDELETQTLSDAELHALERTAAPVTAERAPRTWAGRWFWLAALLFLGVETLMRRSRAAAREELAHAA